MKFGKEKKITKLDGDTSQCVFPHFNNSGETLHKIRYQVFWSSPTLVDFLTFYKTFYH